MLDGHALNPGDLSWEALEALGAVTVHPRTPAEATVQRLNDAGAALTNKARITASDLSNLPKLRYIGIMATGQDNVDVAAATAQGVTVTNVPSYSTDSVAQLVFGLLLELCLHPGAHSQAVHSGQWEQSPDFSFNVSPLSELSGKTFGIAGYGRIGRRTARIAAAFGMRVLVSLRRSSTQAREPDVEFVEWEELLARSDVVSLHCPLTPDTAGLIGREALEKMKPGALLINTARGGLLDEVAVAEALSSGRLGGAGLDVLSREPPSSENPLIRAPRCVITPHIGWATREARMRLMTQVAENLRAYLEGRPVNVVSG